MSNPELPNPVPDGDRSPPASTPAPEPPPAVATRPGFPAIPDVVIEACVGRGGMGVVYRGRQPYIDRVVAVKVLPTAISNDNPKFIERFQREAKLLAGLHHPNIVVCHQAGMTQKGECYLVMEYIDGPNLRDWIDRHGPLTQGDALDVLQSLLQALTYAHENGIIHRDVKPENVLLARKPDKPGHPPVDPDEFHFVAKLVDLGLARPSAKAPTDPSRLTASGSLMGTPATMSPEQFNDPDGVDYRTDIYGLGCVMYHTLVGIPAFNDSELMKVLQRKARGDIPIPRRIRPEIRPEIDVIVRDMLQPDRSHRPSYELLLRRCETIRKNTFFTRRPKSGGQPPPTTVAVAEAEDAASAGDENSGAAIVNAPAVPVAPPPRRTTPPTGVPRNLAAGGPLNAANSILLRKRLIANPLFWIAVLIGLVSLFGIGVLIATATGLYGRKIDRSPPPPAGLRSPRSAQFVAGSA